MSKNAVRIMKTIVVHQETIRILRRDGRMLAPSDTQGKHRKNHIYRLVLTLHQSKEDEQVRIEEVDEQIYFVRIRNSQGAA